MELQPDAWRLHSEGGLWALQRRTIGTFDAEWVPFDGEGMHESFKAMEACFRGPMTASAINEICCVAEAQQTRR
jgi:hypothetical protein